MSVENLPLFFVVMIGVGVVIIVIAMIRLAAIHEEIQYDLGMEQQQDSQHLEELFSYFLQEEEKKNQEFREKVLENSRIEEEKGQDAHTLIRDKNRKSQSINEKHLFDDIITRYQRGESIEEIAKNLKKGIGEVKLVISLYSMR